MKFDCLLTTIDLLSNTADFQSSEQLIEQICDARLKTWYESSWRPMMNHESNLRHLNSNFPCEKQNPSCGLSAYEVSLSNQLLSILEHLGFFCERCLEEKGGKILW